MFDFLNRWRRNELDSVLVFLQLATLLSSIWLMICCILLYRHQYEDYYIGAWQYLASVRLAVPPLFILIASYAFATVTGKTVSDAPKAFWAWLRNRFLQHRYWMSAFCIITTISSVSALIYIQNTAPPQYVVFVQRLLGGESDDQKIAEANIKRMEDKAPQLAERLSMVLTVFRERQKWNYSGRSINTTQPRIFHRALATNLGDADWENNPLRRHALAEVSSMAAQALYTTRTAASKSKECLYCQQRDEAIAGYSRVINSKDPRVTELLRSSAILNTGNVYYYLHEFDKAAEVYQELLSRYASTSAYGNAIAALVAAEKFDDAIKVAQAGKEWSIENRKALAEPVSYASVVANLGFLLWIKGDFSGALQELQSSYDLVNDL